MNGSPPYHDVGAIETFAEGERRTLELHGREIAICLIDGAFYAVNVRCTHAAWTMNDVPLDGCELICTLHGARFDVRDGQPTAGPARRPLERFPVRVRAGRVEVGVAPRPRRDTPAQTGA